VYLLLQNAVTMETEGEPNTSCQWHQVQSLSALTANLPKHFQIGLQSSELVLTCISSFTDHLIIGTNIGLIYLAHIPSLHIVRLKCEVRMQN